MGVWRVRALGAAAILAIAAPAASAHDLSRSESKLTVDGSQVRASITLDVAEFNGVDVNGDGRVSYDELDEAIEGIAAILRAHFTLSSPEPPLRTTIDRYELIDNHLVRLDVLYVFPHPVTRLTVMSALHQVMRPDHRHLMSVRFGGDVQESVLGAGYATATFSATTAHPYLHTLRRFSVLGIEHIFTGYDHLAFLVCLVIVATTFTSLVKVITSFTVAHSVTLALATFDLVVLPVRVTESLIALSIAYVALENLLRFRAVERHRITFLFGLVHGFGFSTILRSMELPRTSLSLSLFSFNAGVEIGQIAFVAVVFPVALQLSSGRAQYVRQAVSLSVACLAIYWFGQRAF